MKNNIVRLTENELKQVIRESVNRILSEMDLGDMEDNVQPIHSLEEYMDILHNTEFTKDNWEIDKQDSNFDQNGGEVVVYLNGDDFDYISLKIYFDLDVSYIPYDKGDYWTPPEGGYHECNSLTITNVEYNMNEEYNGTLEPIPSGLDDLIYEYVMDTIDESYDEESYGPDPDRAYEEYKDRKLGYND